MPFGGLLTAGIIGGSGSIIGGIIGSSASKHAADVQAQAAREALDFQKQVYAQQRTDQQPWLQAGQYSIAQLMDMVKSGHFAVPDVPSFSAPTMEDARTSPGYQFAAQQGSKGILQGAAAAGGAISGGTLKSLAGFNSNLADSTYSNVFNRALSTYGARMAQFQGDLAKSGQEYNQWAGLAGTGQQAVQNLGALGAGFAGNAGNLITGSGNAQAAGIVGSANSISGGLAGAGNAFQNAMLWNQFRNPSGGSIDTGRNIPTPQIPDHILNPPAGGIG